MNIIGLAGGSGSGKTTLVNSIISKYPKGMVGHLPLDAYYLDHGFLTKDEKFHHNFDHPNAIDFDLIIEHVQKLKINLSIKRPIYSFITCSRLPKKVNVESTEILIIDGLFTLFNEDLREVLNYKIFLDVSRENRFDRIIKRDISERGRNRNSVEDRFNNTVDPMHYKYVEPSKEYADIVINGDSKDITSNINYLCSIINSFVHCP